MTADNVTPLRHGDSATRVLLAVVGQRHGYHRPTVRTVADAAGLSISRTHHWLSRLRSDGFITWDDDKTGTLRALVAPVRHLTAVPDLSSPSEDTP